MKEIWKDVTGYEEKYQVSNEGRIKSLPPFNRAGKERILKPINAKGYCKVTIDKKPMAIHRLVSIAFIPNPNNKPCVNHINGITYDNRVENLEWVTYSENLQHAFDCGLKQPHPGHLRSSARKVIDTSTGKIYRTILEAARLTGMDDSSLMRRLHGKVKNDTTLRFY